MFARRETFDLSCMGVVFINYEFTCCISKKGSVMFLDEICVPLTLMEYLLNKFTRLIYLDIDYSTLKVFT